MPNLAAPKRGKTSKPRSPYRAERFSDFQGYKRFLLASTVVGRFHRRSYGCLPRGIQQYNATTSP